MKKHLKVLLLLLISTVSFAQKRTISGLILDETGSAIPYANISIKNTKRGTQADSLGRFEIMILNEKERLLLTTIGYEKKEVVLNKNDDFYIIQLKAKIGRLDEIVVKPPENPAWAIIRKVLANRPLNDPSKYQSYETNAYLKIALGVDSLRKSTKDTITKKRIETRESLDAFIIENYSEIIFKQPNKSKETVVASVNNIAQVYGNMANSIPMDVHPMAFYNELYNFTLQKRFFNNPINSKTFSQYEFTLKDTLINAQDSTFIIAFEPYKGTNFDGFKGLLSINSDGFAIENIELESISLMPNISFKIHQHYSRIDGRWFPQKTMTEISSTLDGKQKIGIIKWKFETWFLNTKINQSIDNKRFDGVQREIKTTATKHTKASFEVFRQEALNERNQNAYDILKRKAKTPKQQERAVKFAKLDSTYGQYLGGLISGVNEFKKVEILTDEIYSKNLVEGNRFGIGIGNNQSLRPRFRIGATVAYGLRDKVFKYDAFGSWNITKDRNYRIDVNYKKGLSTSLATDFLRPNFYKDRQFEILPMRDVDTVLFKPYYFQKKSIAFYCKPQAWNSFRITAENQYRDAALSNIEGRENHFGLTQIMFDWRFAYREILNRSGRLETVINRFYPILQLNVTRAIPKINSNFDFWKYALESKYQIRTRRAGVLDLTLKGEYLNGIFPLQYFSGQSSSVGYLFQKRVILPTNFYSNQAVSDNKSVSLNVDYDLMNLLFRPKTKYSQPRIALLHNVTLNNLNLNSTENNIYKGTNLFLSAGLRVRNLVQIPIFGFKIGLGGSVMMQYGPNKPELLKNRLFFSFLLM
jgi:hypothetical protein